MYFGRDHYRVASTLVNLANAMLMDLAAQSDGPGAYDGRRTTRPIQEILERAVAIYERHYGEHHIKVADTLVALLQARDMEQARDVYGSLGSTSPERANVLDRVLAIQERHFGPNHKETRATKRLLKEEQKVQFTMSGSYATFDLDPAFPRPHEGMQGMIGSQNSAYGAYGQE